MILYSIIPPEVVFGDFEKVDEKEYLEIEYLGEKVMVTPLSNNQYKVDRIISTSPKAYLNPKLMPGEVINGSFVDIK